MGKIVNMLEKQMAQGSGHKGAKSSSGNVSMNRVALNFVNSRLERGSREEILEIRTLKLSLR